MAPPASLPATRGDFLDADHVGRPTALAAANDNCPGKAGKQIFSWSAPHMTKNRPQSA
jgi:hypothetical protein